MYLTVDYLTTVHKSIDSYYQLQLAGVKVVMSPWLGGS